MTKVPHSEYKPARGRAREKQLKAMTKEQRIIENLLKKEKNKNSAKLFREKRKNYIRELEQQIESYEMNKDIDLISKYEKQKEETEYYKNLYKSKLKKIESMSSELKKIKQEMILLKQQGEVIQYTDYMINELFKPF